MTVSSVMQRLASYIARAPKKRLPAAVAEKTKHHVLDTVAAMVSGAPLLPGKQAISYARTRGGTKEACVVGSNIVTSAENAALSKTSSVPTTNPKENACPHPLPRPMPLCRSIRPSP